ncbi:hypothetical protein AB0D86_27125 [Streptomyces sp. NPDC048324]|uniref:hypothetical protein n=1 Tax=Streptomyces sp. NPDC048324 TaxID=3157205 RepID=UPI003415C70F
MSLRKRATAAVFVATMALAALAPQAVAAPMPWETSKGPTHHVVSSAAGSGRTVTVLCGAPCYQ